MLRGWAIGPSSAGRAGGRGAAAPDAWAGLLRSALVLFAPLVRVPAAGLPAMVYRMPSNATHCNTLKPIMTCAGIRLLADTMR